MVSKRDQDEKEEEKRAEGRVRTAGGWNEKSFALRVQRSARPPQQERRYGIIFWEYRINIHEAKRASAARTPRTGYGISPCER